MIYFLSDAHFLHKGIMRHCPWRQRWPDVNAMNEGIIKIWNDSIKPEDTVYFLGDLALGKPSKLKKIIPRLNGHKIMVLGNHDLGRQFYLDNGFERVYDSRTAVAIGGRIVDVSHYPFKPGFFKQLYYHIFDRKMLRELGKHPIDEGQILIHGHVHSRWGYRGRMINAGLDAHVGPNGDPKILSEHMILNYLDTFSL